MVFSMASVRVLLVLCSLYWTAVFGLAANQTATLIVDASGKSSQPISDIFFGIFFEEINHAGAGGLWAELVSNRGFESGGQTAPSNIDPWSIIGNETKVVLSTDRSSCFTRNIMALQMDVLCDSDGSNICPAGGVGLYNPGYWGMNIEQGKTYKLSMHIRSEESVNLSVSLSSSNGSQHLASASIISAAGDFSNWTKVELLLKAKETDRQARLQLTTIKKGVIWFDQVSVMPVDTYMGHGFRKELASMIADLKPKFMRFPGGSFVEGEWLRNAVRWKETIGPWEERPGHFGDVWNYWTDDGIGYFELLQLSEDLGVLPIWVVNNGISHNDEVATSTVLPFIQEILDSIEFARGSADSKWGLVRAAMGHKEPFNLSHIAIGNEDCGRMYYLGNYLRFYDAIKDAYPDMKIISNCDGSSKPLDHPADFYDFHIYTSAKDMFSRSSQFANTIRNESGPKAFVSEYAVTGNDAGKGSLLAALGEAGFLIGLEHNSDVVHMFSYAPLFVNENDRRWNPDAIVFNSFQQYGTPSYWVQYLFKESSGATLLPATLQSNSSNSLIASAITWVKPENDFYLRIKIVNFRNTTTNLNISISGLDAKHFKSGGSTKTVLTSSNPKDENSFNKPNKVVPVTTSLDKAGPKMNVVLSSYSFTIFDLLLDPTISPVYASSI